MRRQFILFSIIMPLFLGESHGSSGAIPEKPAQALIQEQLDYIQMPALTPELLKNITSVAFIERQPLHYLRAFEGRVVDVSEGSETKSYLEGLREGFNIESGRLVETYTSIFSQTLKKTTPDEVRTIRKGLQKSVQDGLRAGIGAPKEDLRKKVLRPLKELRDSLKLKGKEASLYELLILEKFLPSFLQLRLGHIPFMVGIALSVAPNIHAVVCNENNTGFEVTSGEASIRVEKLLQSFANAAKSDAKVVNMSFGGSVSLEMEKVFSTLARTNKLIVIGAGNDRCNLSSFKCMQEFSYKASFFDNVLIVVNVNQQSNRRAEDSSYPGPKLESSTIGAPGMGVRGFQADGTIVLKENAATSGAAALASGAAAFISAQFPNRQGDELAFLIKKTTTRTPKGVLITDDIGLGVLNVSGALALGYKLKDYTHITAEIAEIAYKMSPDSDLYPLQDAHALNQLAIMTKMVQESLPIDPVKALAIAGDILDLITLGLFRRGAHVYGFNTLLAKDISGATVILEKAIQVARAAMSGAQIEELGKKLLERAKATKDMSVREHILQVHKIFTS